jgi:hypothetical protein
MITGAQAQRILGERAYQHALTRGAAWNRTQSILCDLYGEPDRADAHRFVEWAVTRLSQQLPIDDASVPR